jgi:hypothetical protein
MWHVFSSTVDESSLPLLLDLLAFWKISYISTIRMYDMLMSHEMRDFTQVKNSNHASFWQQTLLN